MIARLHTYLGEDVKSTLLLTIGLVILVIFTSCVIFRPPPFPWLPMSLVGTFGVMYFWGTVSIIFRLWRSRCRLDFVVDDAIVMLENIVRHIEKGRNREAAMKGAGEIGFTILSMTLSLCAVFIPSLFMGGILGRLLHEFAVTIGAAILVSGFCLTHADTDAVQPFSATSAEFLPRQAVQSE